MKVVGAARVGDLKHVSVRSGSVECLGFLIFLGGWPLAEGIFGLTKSYKGIYGIIAHIPQFSLVRFGSKI